MWHESNLCLGWKPVSLYWKPQSFNFLMFTVLARQREKNMAVDGFRPPPPSSSPLGLRSVFTRSNFGANYFSNWRKLMTQSKISVSWNNVRKNWIQKMDRLNRALWSGFLYAGLFYRVSQKKVSIKNFYSELLTTSIHSFWIYLDSVYL